MHSRVLIFSRDATLVQTRQLILGTFFEAEGAERIQEAQALIDTRRYDLIILCYTLSESECRRVCDLVANRRPRPKMLVLSPPGLKASSREVDMAQMTDSGSYSLLKKAAEMLGVDLQNRALAAV